MQSSALPPPVANRNLQLQMDFEEQFQAGLSEGFATRVRSTLYEIGVPPRLHKATLGPVPVPIKTLKCWDAFPARNFGLVGPPGCGKSMALVYRMVETLRREMAEAGPRRLEDTEKGPRQIVPTLKTEFRWVGWPAMARRMKSLAAQKRWDDPTVTVEGILTWIKQAPERRVLILDDIGEENPGGYPSEQLALLVDEADNYEGRVFWTSNHTVEQLHEPGMYGARMVSRLTGMSPDAVLPADLPDLRIRRAE